MNPKRLVAHAAAVAGLSLLAMSAVAQAPQPAAGAHPHFTPPNPTNLKVLPKALTGEQVMEIMHGWEKQLGVECNTCHTVDPNKKMPNGRPALNFPDDSKPEKETARLMVKMTMEINKNYTSMVESKQNNEVAAKQVTCGTCHRGKFDPPAYVPPPDHQHEHHDAPPAAGETPGVPH